MSAKGELPPEQKGKHRVQVDVPAEQIDRIAKKTGTTRAGVIRDAIGFTERLADNLEPDQTLTILDGETGKVKTCVKGSVIFRN